MLKLSSSITGEGKIVLFLHGWNHSIAIWNQVIPTIKKHFKCISLDLPGFGKSRNIIPSDITLDDYSQIIVENIRNLVGEEQIYGCVGDSFGGLILLNILENNLLPQKMAVICGCPIEGLSGLLKIIKIRGLISTSLLITQKVPKEIGDMMIKVLASYTIRKKKHISNDLIQSIREANPKIAEKIFFLINNIPKFNYSKIVENNHKFLVLRGEKDRVVRTETSMKLAANLNCEYFEIPLVGHTPMQENPDIFAEKVIKFFKKED